jgi:hypothetical protein
MTQWTAPEALAYLTEARCRDEEPDAWGEPGALLPPEGPRRLEDEPSGFAQGDGAVWARWGGANETGSWCGVPEPGSRRVYTVREERVLGTECRAFLDELTALGILDHLCRELVVDRVLTLDPPDLALEDLCWVVFRVLNGASDSDDGDAPPLGWPFLSEPDYCH